MIARWLPVVCVSCLVLSNAVQAASILLRVDAGEVKQWSTKTAGWTTVSDSGLVESGDSIAVADKGHATVDLAGDATLKMRGVTSGAFKIGDNGLMIHLAKGQIFLTRTGNSAFSTVMLLSHDCKFIPIGTAAALRTDNNGEPIVAVLQGKIRAESPNGQAVEVAPGMQGAFDPATGAFKVAELPPSAVTALEQWSGVTSEKPAAAQQPVAETTPQPQQPPTQQPQGQSPSSTKDTSHTTATQPGQQPKSGAGQPPTKAPTTQAIPEKPQFELSAGVVTVDNTQWTRIAFGVDIPIWKFGVFLDVELFLDSAGRFSDKGWQFDKDNWLPSLTRKIRYLRFGHETEPVFVKLGGIDNVTLGYGFVMDRFTNMLHYPSEKLLGFQFYLNDISPIGFTMQTMVADFLDFQNRGGVLGARLGLRPFKPSGVPVLNALTVAGTYATDLNQFAPARHWRYEGNLRDKNGNNLIDDNWALTVGRWDSASVRTHSNAAMGDSATFDSLGTRYHTIDTTYRDSTDAFAVIGADISLPIIQTSLVQFSLYGQGAVSYNSDAKDGADKIPGWGFGAPGAALTVGPFWMRAEYRHIQDEFIPGYFGPYYLDERIQRLKDTVLDKEKNLSVYKGQNLNGIFGTVGCNIANVLIISGTYQYLFGRADTINQFYEATAGIGDLIVKKIPRLSKVEAYVSKTNIGITPVYDTDGKLVRDKDFFSDLTPYFYFGYRVGVEITKGASLIWDARYGFSYDENNKRVPNNNVSIMTAITF